MSSLSGLLGCSLATPLDALVPFVPWSIVAYASLWLLWWVPAWKATPERFRQFLIAAAASNAVACIVFVVCRDDGARRSLVGLQEPLRLMYEALYAVDPAGNAFPSLHAADTVLVVRSLVGQPNEGWFVAWGALVITASVLTKQHVILDVVAGAALACLAEAMVKALGRRPP